LAVGEVLGPGPQQGADAVEGVAGTAAVPGGVLLDASADVVQGGGAEGDDVQGVQDGGGVLELVADGVVVAVERVHGRDLDTGAERLGPGGEPVGVGPTRTPGQ